MFHITQGFEKIVVRKQAPVMWFTSDLHLGHEKIIQLCNRPFKNLDEMHGTIIDRWNWCVQEQDAVIILGDLALGNRKQILQLCKGLNGSLYLVPGNHDYCFSGRKKIRPADLKMYEDVGFTFLDEVSSLYHASYRDGDIELVLSHFPYEGDSRDDDRYSDHRPVDKGKWLIHGHVHNAWKVNGRQINVGVDVWNFTPVSMDRIISIIEDSENER